MAEKKKRKCPECKGRGEVECITQEQSGFKCDWDCSVCGGSGKMPCPRCHGNGYVVD
ncbi:MAG: hypothetical protein KHY41_19805 [Enterocloster sp.]|uniref:hypothetical protein n=1 Tax=Enterocloster TaxID=2719313 RepID=UPI0025798803|nr:hypothetical protein [Enterocloster sp.]MBS5405965.1 hypothetical protein [Enterocloster sp.]